MKAWGILGEPTKEQIQRWMDLPYGSFKIMVNDLNKKSKGKSLRKYTVEVRKPVSEYQLGYIDVNAYDVDHALELAKQESVKGWSEKKKDSDKYSYRVSQIWN